MNQLVKVSNKEVRYMVRFMMLLGCVVLFGTTAQAQLTLTVDNTTDDGSLTACTAAANDCSLRGAITRANSVFSNDTIEFDLLLFSAPRMITLSGTPLQIGRFLQTNNAGSLTINGRRVVTVSGGNLSNVFVTNSSFGVTLTGLTITQGKAVSTGGGIENYGKLTVTDSTISQNTAGFSGGGIGSSGTLIVLNSTVSNNSVSPGAGHNGGGVATGGVATFINSTVSGNSVDMTTSWAGGISHRGGTFNLINSTVVNNTSGSGGGIDTYLGTFNVRNSIIANNNAPREPDCYCTDLNSQGYNLIENTEGTVILGVSTGNIIGVDPGLGELRDNGGGTFTHALLPNSPAIDAGSNSLAVDLNNQPLSTDQRGAGFPRVHNGRVDIGAFEVSPQCTPPAITTQPGSQSIQAGQTATLSVINNGTTPLTYQWYEGESGNTTKPVGSNSSSFTTTILTATTKYWVRISNQCGSIDSNTATVTVSNCTPPAITTQPSSQTVLQGQTATLSVTTTGTLPLTYQWYEGERGDTSRPVGVSLTSFTTPTLSATRTYWVSVSNSCGSVNSATATVIVQNQCRVSDLSPITDQETLEFENAASDTPNFSLFPPYVESTLSTNIMNLRGSISTTLGFNSLRTSGYRPFAYQAHFYELKTKLKAIQDAINMDPLQASACAELKSRIDNEIDNKHQIPRSSMTNLPLVNPPDLSAHTTNPATAVDLSGIKNLPPAQQNVIDQLANQNGLTRPCVTDKVHFTLIGAPCQLSLSITVQSPVNILVTDPLGRRIGFDPVRSSVVNEIGASAYYSGPSTEPQLLDIGAMVAGTYTITGIGTATGSYTITIQTLDEDAGVNSSQVISGIITLGQTISLTATATYTINGRVIDGNGAGIGGVTISLSGSQTASTQTDSDGNYSFVNLPTGNYTITPSKSNYAFSPGNQIITNLSSAQTANFTGTPVTFNIAGQVTINNVGFGVVTITLEGSKSQTTNTDLSGNYQFANLLAGGNYTITPSKTNYTFTPQNRIFANLSGNQTASFTATINPGVPILVSEETSTRAIALGSPVWLRDPFQLNSPVPWAIDGRTRVMLFAMNFDLLPGENVSVVTADAEDASHRIYPLTVEYVGKVPGFDWLSCVVVRLNDDMGDIGDVLVRINVRGVSSNRVRLGIGRNGGGPLDVSGAIPTPGHQP